MVCRCSGLQHYLLDECIKNMTEDNDIMVLSYYQTRTLLQAKQDHKTSTIASPDLGHSDTEVFLEAKGARFPGHGFISWDAISGINKARNNCFLIQEGQSYKIQKFSEQTNRYYSLMPTDKAPTLLISGTLMHRIKGIDPWADTKEKMRAAAPVTGHVLDTSTGLGYTAIMAADRAVQVTTIELDPAVLEVARLNPWSDKLFMATNISRRIGDSGDLIHEFENQTFHCIIHDPPVVSLAGYLYGMEFYRELYRVLRSKGRLFHYIGDPKSPSGKTTTRGVICRLQEAGFQRVQQVPKAFGVVAIKP